MNSKICDRHSSLKPRQSPTLLENRHHSVTFKLHNDSSSRLIAIDSALSLAKDSHFNQRYLDYKYRIKEVNKAKDILKNNRQTMSIEVKKKMVAHIKHKMTIIQLIEEELQMD